MPNDWCQFKHHGQYWGYKKKTNGVLSLCLKEKKIEDIKTVTRMNLLAS
jgi:hypothetical protein